LAGKELVIGFDRSDLLGSVERMVGPNEWKKNERMWRMRAKSSAKALGNAVEDYFAKTPDQRLKIKNSGAWLTNRFERCEREVAMRR
jgi:hypothetical protein